MSDQMLVGQIEELLKRDERHLHAFLQDVRVAESGATFHVTDDEGTEHAFDFDEVCERSIASFLDVNPTYIEKCPPAVKAYNLNYWLDHHGDARGEFLVGPGGIETVYDPDDTILTPPMIAKMMSNVFDEDNVIVRLDSEPNLFHADVMTHNRIEVPGNGVGDRPGPDGYLHRPNEGQIVDGEEIRPIRVDDVTHGGIRFITHPTKPKVPVVERYMHRLICQNGLTIQNVDRRIVLKGHTVTDVLAEMEQAAEELLSTMDEALEKYAESSRIRVPGNPLGYMRQVGVEAGLSNRIILRALDDAAALGLGDADFVSQYDVLNVFTRLGTHGNVRYSTMRKLQAFGGDIVTHAEEWSQRCQSCERVLPHAAHLN